MELLPEAIDLRITRRHRGAPSQVVDSGTGPRTGGPGVPEPAVTVCPHTPGTALSGERLPRVPRVHTFGSGSAGLGVTAGRMRFHRDGGGLGRSMRTTNTEEAVTMGDLAQALGERSVLADVSAAEPNR
ncbi:hypothetical protein GCM10007079_23530 [Nocardiopsis terrae]|nr:hypothetical protein GCM10007079_23530 [Nocardiopsis terrae]